MFVVYIKKISWIYNKVHDVKWEKICLILQITMKASLQQNLYFNHVDKLKFSIAVKQEQGQNVQKNISSKLESF